MELKYPSNPTFNQNQHFIRDELRGKNWHEGAKVLAISKHVDVGFIFMRFSSFHVEYVIVLSLLFTDFYTL